MLVGFSQQLQASAKSLAEIADLLGPVAEDEDERAELVHLMNLYSGNMTTIAKELAVTPA